MVIDTCQAASMFGDIEASNFIGISSSRVGENSWSHRYDESVSTSLADRFTSVMVETLLASENQGSKRISDLVDSLNYVDVLSHPTTHINKYSGSAADASFSDFILGVNTYLSPSVFGSLPVRSGNYSPPPRKSCSGTLHIHEVPADKGSHAPRSYTLVPNNPPCPSYTYSIILLTFVAYIVVAILYN